MGANGNMLKLVSKPAERNVRELDERIICGWDNSLGNFAFISVESNLVSVESKVDLNRIAKRFEENLQNGALPEEKRGMVFLDIHGNNFRFQVRLGTYSPDVTKDDVQLKRFVESTAMDFIEIIYGKGGVKLRE